MPSAAPVAGSTAAAKAEGSVGDSGTAIAERCRAASPCSCCAHAVPRCAHAVQDMYTNWMFFRVTLDMLEMVFAKADPRVVKM